MLRSFGILQRNTAYLLKSSEFKTYYQRKKVISNTCQYLNLKEFLNNTPKIVHRSFHPSFIRLSENILHKLDVTHDIRHSYSWSNIWKLFSDGIKKLPQDQFLMQNQLRLADVVTAQLCEIRAWSKSVELIENMVNKGIIPSLQSFSNVMSACNQAGHWEKAIEIFKYVETLNLIPDSSCYESLLYSYAEARNFPKVVQVFNEVKSNTNVKLSIGHYDAMLFACNRCNQIDFGMKIYNEMENNFHPNLASIQNIIEMFAVEENPHDLFDFLSQCKEKKVLARSEIELAYGIAISSFVPKYSLCKDFVSKMMKNGITPRASDFQNVILSSIYSGKYAESTDILSQMKSLLVVPTSKSFEIIITAFNAVGSDGAKHLPDEMKRLGIKRRHMPLSCLKMPPEKSVPFYHLDADQRANIMLIRYMEKIQNEQKNGKVIFDMIESCVSSGFALHGRTITKSIQLLASIGQWRKAIELLDLIISIEEARKKNMNSLMVAAAPSPNVHMFTAAISACTRKKNIEVALKLFEKMKSYGIEPNMTCYITLLNICAKTGQSKVALDILTEMQRLETELDMSIDPDSTVYRLVLQSCGKNYKWELSVKIFRSLSNLGIPLTTELYNALIYALSQSEKNDMNLDILQEMKAKGVQIDEYTLGTVMRGFAKAKDVSRCLQLLAECRSLNPPIEPTLVLYNTVIYACSLTGNYEEAERLIEEIKKKGLEPDDVTYSHLSVAFTEAGLSDRAIAVLEEIKGHGLVSDTRMYNVLVETCVKDNKWKEALEYLNTMTRNGTEYDSFTVNSGLAVSSKIFGVGGAIEYLDEMKKRHEFNPALVNYSCLMQLCMQNGKSQDCLKVLQVMYDEGVRSDTFIHNWVMKKLNQEGKHEAAIAIFNLMTKHHVTPDVSSYRQLHVALKKLNRLEEMICSLDEMKQRGLEVDIFAYSMVMNACNKAKKWLKASDLFREMIDANIQPDVSCFEIYFISLAEQRKWKEMVDAYELFQRSHLLKSERIYSHLIMAHAQLNAPEEAKALLSEYEQNTNMSQDLYCYTAMMFAYNRSRQWRQTLELLRSMVNRGIELNAVVYSFAITACIGDGQTKEVREIWKQMKKTGIMPSFRSYAMMIRFEAELKEWKNVLRLIAEMKKNGFTPAEETYSCAIEACIEAGEKQSADHLRQEMNAVSIKEYSRRG